MMEAVALLQSGATVVLNVSFAWLVGALSSVWWLPNDAALRPTMAILWRTIARAAALCLAASLLALWCALSLMADVGPIEALGLLPTMLTATAYGNAALAGLLAMGLLLLLILAGRCALPAAALLLVGFALARASNSHAGEHGLLSAGTAIEWLHLVLVGLWVGLVAVAGWIVLPALYRQETPMRAYLATVSGAATWALGGIIASGGYNAWQRMETLEQLRTHNYGMLLTLKLLLVAGAACLGAFNRFRGFPAATTQGRRATLVLRIESLVLLGALVSAAWLTLEAPPR